MRSDVVTCPVCQGNGCIDSRSFSAPTRELIREMGLPHLVICLECDGARVVTPDRYMELLNSARRLMPVEAPGLNGHEQVA